MKSRIGIGGLLLLFTVTLVVAADEAPVPAAAVPAEEALDGIFSPETTRRVLILCGLTGDADHHRAFADMIGQLHSGLSSKLGVAPENITVLFGDEPDDKDPEPIRKSPRSTKEEVEAAIASFIAATQPDDSAWVFVIGHTHYEGRNAWWNLPGPDIAQADFGKLFQSLKAREQVFFLTTSVSGLYIKPLSVPGRVVISATEADWETNETEFPFKLAELLTKPPTTAELDADKDGSLTLFDLYIVTARSLAQSYAERMLLATEHALLDDNGDGRGTELQIDYLSEDLGGRVRRGRLVPPKVAPNTDGALAKLIPLPPNFASAEEPMATPTETTAAQ
jgi:hypothetical protein